MDIIARHDSGDINIVCDIKSAKYSKEDDCCRISTEGDVLNLENIAKIIVVSDGKYKTVVDNYQNSDIETLKGGVIGLH